MASVSSLRGISFHVAASSITAPGRYRVVSKQSKSISYSMARSDHEYRAITSEFPGPDECPVEIRYDFDHVSCN